MAALVVVHNIIMLQEKGLVILLQFLLLKEMMVEFPLILVINMDRAVEVELLQLVYRQLPVLLVEMVVPVEVFQTLLELQVKALVRFIIFLVVVEEEFGVIFQHHLIRVQLVVQVV